MAVTSPYETLGVAPGASEREIRVAFLAAAARLHPDRGGDPAAFAAARAAWEVLREPGGRERAARAAAPATRGGAQRDQGAPRAAATSEAGRRWCRNAESRARERDVNGAASDRDGPDGSFRDEKAWDASRRDTSCAAASTECTESPNGACGAECSNGEGQGPSPASWRSDPGSGCHPALRAAHAQLAAGRPRHALFQAREVLRAARRSSCNTAGGAFAEEVTDLMRRAEDALREAEERDRGADEWERDLEQTWAGL